jgi:hypothetical protein
MKKKNDILLLKRFMYPTSDDWSPNFPRNCVECKMYEYIDANGETCMFRLHVGGADDTSMEYDVKVTKDDASMVREALVTFFNDLPNPITKEGLREHGFVRG